MNGKVFTLYVTDLGLIPQIPYGPPASQKVIPESEPGLVTPEWQLKIKFYSIKSGLNFIIIMFILEL